ncbi:hypothetical protein C7974DRAFT_374626 [Boeremia exigua]|uniref:uncharacterized protein n=1 Tax=Boeremia exigua TaxID=749465 RepID=UPI001E8D0E1D|nr:uncharacterized protein C7974DRAFT_374626 [Boeremia exigua]KAH6638021.1 hypothetical protein C7974DRAFT_374626 [Boeremia exigua]
MCNRAGGTFESPMASSLENAPVRIDPRPKENAIPGKLANTSQRTTKATVEDYFSDDEQKDRTGEREDGMKQPQPKSIIVKSTIPKRASVSWPDEPLGSRGKNISSINRTSRLSEAQTVVGSDIDDGGRPPSPGVRGRSPTRRPGERLPLVYGPRVREAEGEYTNSEEEDDWYPTRAVRGRVARPGRVARRRPSPAMYMNFEAPTASREHTISGPRRPELRHARHYENVVTPAPYQSWSHPHSHSWAEPFEYVRRTRGSAPTHLEHPSLQVPYDDYPLPASSHRGYAPLSRPRGGPVVQPATLQRPAASRQDSGEASNTAPQHDHAKQTQVVAVNEAGQADNHKDSMRNLQPTPSQAPAQAKGIPLTDIDLIPTPRLLSATETQAQVALTDLELIKLMERRMQLLKQKNEEKLLEANQVLDYLKRGSQRAMLKPDDKIEPPADVAVNVPNVHDFRTPEDETDYDHDSEDSSSSDGDSVAGNSSGSSISSLGQKTRQISSPGHAAESRLGARTDRHSVESTIDETLSSSDSDQESTSGSGRSSDGPDITEPIHSGGPRSTLVEHAPKTQANNDMMDEVITLRRDLSILKRQMTRQNKNWFGHSVVTRWRKYFSKAPRPGTQRLEWICECGEEMYADLPIENSAQYQQMLEFLTRPGPKTQQASHNQKTPSQLEGGTGQQDYASLQSSQSSFMQGAAPAPASTIGSGSTCVGTGISQFPSTQQTDPYARNKYLELCVNVGKYETKLAEIQVSSSQSNGAAICTDAHLFRQIYHRYFALRKHTWRRFLYRPAGIKFVHFGVQAGYRVSFFSSDPLPSEDEIAAKRYEYNPQPPVPPPIDSRTFLHYFYNHSMHSHSTSAKYVNRLPKKLGDSLTRSLGVDDLLEGWGIHIIEGPNKVAICWALMIVLIASLGVSVGYNLVTKSEDSGFAIGQWMVAALTVALSALYFSLEDDVDSTFD